MRVPFNWIQAYSFTKYLSSTYYMSGDVLGTGDIAVKSSSFLVEEKDRKQTNI